LFGTNRIIVIWLIIAISYSLGFVFFLVARSTVQFCVVQRQEINIWLIAIRYSLGFVFLVGYLESMSQRSHDWIGFCNKTISLRNL
jgi:hypothetical protein